jgi:asparagine synthase (glutamine-hydrolysing)
MDKILKEQSDNYIQKTFTVGSEVSEYDETKYAEEVLKLTNARGYYVTPTSDGLFNDMEKLLYHLEDPFPSTSCYASWCVYKLANDSGVKVTLDGQGPDELLGGYEKYMFPSFLLELFMNGYFNEFNKNLSAIKNIYGYTNSYQLKEIGKEAFKLSGFMTKRYKNKIKNNALIKKEFAKNYFDESYIHSEYLDNNSYFFNLKNSYSNLQKNYYYTLSLQSLLRVVDRNSMAHSVEARVPFLDYRLVEFIYSLPHNYKIRKGITKYILRESMKNRLTDNIINRKKIGFVTAEKNWFEERKENIMELINAKKFRIKEILINDNLESYFDSSAKNFITTNVWKFLVVLQLMDIFNLTI